MHLMQLNDEKEKKNKHDFLTSIKRAIALFQNGDPLADKDLLHSTQHNKCV